MSLVLISKQYYPSLYFILIATNSFLIMLMLFVEMLLSLNSNVLLKRLVGDSERISFKVLDKMVSELLASSFWVWISVEDFNIFSKLAISGFNDFKSWE